MDNRISTVPGDTMKDMNIGIILIMEMKDMIINIVPIMEMKILIGHERMEMKMKFILSCLHFETNLIQSCPNYIFNIKSKVLIDSIDSKCILGTDFRSTVSIDLFDSTDIWKKCFESTVLIDLFNSKFFNLMITVQVDSFDPISMSKNFAS